MQAGKLPVGAVSPAGPPDNPHDRVKTGKGLPVDPGQRLTAQQVADRAGVTASTLRAYIARGYAPKPDGKFGRDSYWLEATIERWLTNRAGQGARTDLENE